MSRKPATEDDVLTVIEKKGPITWKDITDELRRKGRSLSAGDFSAGEKSLKYLVEDQILRAERLRVSKKERRKLERVYGSSGKRFALPMEYSLT